MSYRTQLLKVVFVLAISTTATFLYAAEDEKLIIWLNSPLTAEQIEAGLEGVVLTEDEKLTNNDIQMLALTSEDSCRAVLEHAAYVYASEFSVDDKKSWTYAKACGSSEGSQNIGVDILIESMPVGLSAGQESRSKWCNENKSYETNYQSYQKLENKVFATAISNWRQCILAKQNNLITTVNISTTDTVFQFNVANRTGYEEKITKVNVLSDLNEGISCSPEVSESDPIAIQPGQTKSILCSRNYVSVLRDGEMYQVLPAGTITFFNTLSPFFYTFNERFKSDDPPPEDAPRKIVIPLNGQHIGTKGYWAKGRRSTLLFCANRIDQPQAGYELVEVTNRREERVDGFGGRGRCGVGPYCDSHGEFCNEVYFDRACFINVEWHNYYKALAAEKNLGYSKESVCSL